MKALGDTTTTDFWRKLAWPICGLSLVAGFAALVFAVGGHSDGPLGRSIGLTFSMAAFGVVGALIASRLPRQPIAWLFLAVAVGANVAGATSAYGHYLLATQDSPFSGVYAVWLGSWLFGAAILLNIFVLLLVPTGRLASARWRPLIWLACLMLVTYVFMTALMPGQIPHSEVENPAGLGWVGQAEPIVSRVFPPLLGFLLVSSVIHLVLRARRARGTERQQFKWFAYGVVLVIVVDFIVNPLFVGDPVLEDLPFSIGIGILPIATGLAILRYRLYEIDRIISRTVTYGLVVALLGLVVLGLVTGMAIFLPSDDPLVVAVATLVVFALFNPMRRRVQGWVDRRFNRSRYDAALVIESFADTLKDRVDPEGVINGWIGVVSETMQPEGVAVWVK